MKHFVIPGQRLRLLSPVNQPRKRLRGNPSPKGAKTMNGQRKDPHSYACEGEPKIDHIQWSARVSFEDETLDCRETMFFNRSGATVLDTRDIEIMAITDHAGNRIPYTLGDAHPILGSPLRFTVPSSRKVRGVYRTIPKAKALCWLKPGQTAGGKHPFVASKAQHDNARSFILCRDTASERFTFEAELNIPRELRGLMAARSLGDRRYEGDRTIECWEMPFTIPSYLFTFFAGDVQFRELSERCGVWAEPSVLENAAWELGEQEAVLQIAESMLGPYCWGRYDIIVTPKFYPSAGMENPMLTSISSIMLTGTRELMYVQDHESIHPWIGNRTTHANAEHYWLNEGMTDYYTGRIAEKRYGAARRFIWMEISRLSSQNALETQYKKTPHLAHLRPVLQGEPAAMAMSHLPYHKGAMLMYALERAIGPEAVDEFMREYLEAFAFRSITTEEWLEFAHKRISRALEKIRIQEWMDTTELSPHHAPRIPYHDFRPVVMMAERCEIPHSEVAQQWGIAQWNLYLQTLKRPVPDSIIRALDDQYQLSTASKRLPIQYRFLQMAIASGDMGMLPIARTLLTSMGNRGIAGFLFGAMANRPEMHAFARDTYAECKPLYHATAQADVEQIFKDCDVAL